MSTRENRLKCKESVYVYKQAYMGPVAHCGGAVCVTSAASWLWIVEMNDELAMHFSRFHEFLSSLRRCTELLAKRLSDVGINRA
jgi:hypothetical protein